MNRWTRAVSTLAVFALVASHAAPASASAQELENRGSVNVVFDAMVLRPLGLATTVLGAGAFALISPVVAMTRPQDIRKPMDFLVMRPVRYTFSDPLGHH